MAVQRMQIAARNERVSECASRDPDIRDGWLLSPPYQRGEVWDDQRRRLLILSLLRGIPVGAITINRRRNPDNPVEWAAVIDGKQRILAIRAFVDSELAVPASWFAEDPYGTYIVSTCGPIEFDGDHVEGVLYSGLTQRGRTLFNDCTIGVCEAHLATVEEEAALFTLINFGGVAQTDEDRRRAAAVASSALAARA